MAFNNQGSRPNYQSSFQQLTYKPKAYSTRDHEAFLGAATAELSEITERAYPSFHSSSGKMLIRIG